MCHPGRYARTLGPLWNLITVLHLGREVMRDRHRGCSGFGSKIQSRGLDGIRLRHKDKKAVVEVRDLNLNFRHDVDRRLAEG
jgi:hypothetical protein